MQIIYKTFLSGVVVLLLSAGCKKDTTDDVSKIFKVPFITVKGDAAVSVSVGGSYSDAGADYTGEDGQVSTIQATSNDIDFTKPGLYRVNYHKVSESGIYEAEAIRFVAITSVNNPVDRSGEYLRNVNGTLISCFIKKVGNGLYEVTNPGGAAAGTDVVVYFVETALNTFISPAQPTTAGDFSVIEINFTATGASWRVVNPGYGTGPRIFVKKI